MEDPKILSLSLEHCRRRLETETNPATRARILRLVADISGLLAASAQPLEEDPAVHDRTARAAMQTTGSPHRGAESGSDLFHRLGERIMAASAYAAALCAAFETAPVQASADSINSLDKAIAQLDEATELYHHLRRAYANRPLQPAYRICFKNRSGDGTGPFDLCQGSIVIGKAASREAAVEIAKERFAEIHGISDWQARAATIEFEVAEVDEAAANPKAA